MLCIAVCQEFVVPNIVVVVSLDVGCILLGDVIGADLFPGGPSHELRILSNSIFSERLFGRLIECINGLDLGYGVTCILIIELGIKRFKVFLLKLFDPLCLG